MHAHAEMEGEFFDLLRVEEKHRGFCLVFANCQICSSTGGVLRISTCPCTFSRPGQNKGWDFCVPTSQMGEI